MRSPDSLRAAILRRIAERGLTGNSLAALAGITISRSQIYRYLDGECDLTGEKLDELLDVLDLRIVNKKEMK